jgi:hypothetical protein
MQAIYGSTATLAVAIIYYLWRDYTQVQQRRERALRERVTYMLWVMAAQLD